MLFLNHGVDALRARILQCLLRRTIDKLPFCVGCRDCITACVRPLFYDLKIMSSAKFECVVAPGAPGSSNSPYSLCWMQ